MNIMRSRSERTTWGGSQPDLSRMSEESSESQITFRKRKQPPERDCPCSEEIKLMRNELSRVGSLLESYVSSNSQIINQMTQSISEVKSEITELKSSHEQMQKSITLNIADICTQINDIKSISKTITSEHDHIKGQLSLLESKIQSSQDKILALESNLNLKINVPSTHTDALSTNEQIIREIQERKKRECNIIIFGIPEQTSSNTHERILNDETEVINIISSITKDITNPKKIFRIGKYNPEKTRRIKVCFEKSDPAMILLRNKDKIPNNIKLFSDQTPSQQKFFQRVKSELTQRTNNGEKDLTIKYINGVPSIIKSVAKNSKNQ